MRNLQPFIREYINGLDETRLNEEYKWKALVRFRKHFRLHNISYDIVRDAFAEHKNLLAATNYFPLGMLKKVATYQPKELEKMFARLFDEKVGLGERVNEYMVGFKSLMETLSKKGIVEWNTEKPQTFQDPHSISVYLFYRFPEKHYIYKSSVFEAFAKKVDYSIANTDRNRKIEKYLEFEDVCRYVKSILIKEGELIEDYNKWMKINGYVDPYYNLLTQDFIYDVACSQSNTEYDKNVSTDYCVVRGKNITHHAENHSFVGVKDVDYDKKDKLCKRLGTKGEEFVVKFEKKRLREKGIEYNVVHIPTDEGDGMGYDVESVEDDGITPKYIEVKTTTGPVDRPFFFSQNELDFSELNADHYYLYRVYDYDDNTKEGKVGITKGSLKKLRGIPIQYKAVVEIKDDEK